MRISEVRLPAADLEPLRYFYVGRLELPLAARRDDAFCVEAGATRLWFEQGPETSSHFAFNVPPDRFEDAKAWAGERAELLRGPDGGDEFDFSAWDARAAYFIDPAGNVVELIARNRLAGALDAPPAPGPIAEVSEIGVPVADVGDAVAALESELGVDHFDGDRESFSAVGDDRGLFIVVPVGRGWFPVPERVAGDAPLEVEVRGAYERELRLPGSRHRVAVSPG
jgi:catechol-2,3-dioxygenase